MNLINDFLENLKMAVESIKSNKMRSFLTMLGIIIGISSVITIVSLGQGAKNSINDQISTMGATNVTISVDTSKAGQSQYITLDDIKQIRTKIDTIKYAAPEDSETGSISSQIKTNSARITGGNVDLASMNNYEITYGRFYNEREFTESKPVVVIDENAAQQLFGYIDCIGKTVKLGPTDAMKTVTIVGIKKSSSFFVGGAKSKMPYMVDVPITYLQNLFPSSKMTSFIISSTNQNNIADAGNSAVSMLEARHNSRGLSLYSASNNSNMMSQVNTILNTFTMFLGAVAAISLLVGGIGVMNIMLVSVTERTKEIGIRKAIGATTSVILYQFLTEAVIISLIGGIIGMISGISIAFIAGHFVSITPSLSAYVIIGAILFSSIIGIFFGIYPAKKAAELDPIDALRYE